MGPAGRRIAYGDVSEPEDGTGQERQIDRPGDRDPGAGGLGQPVLDQRPMAVPIDEMRPDQGRGQDADHQDCQNGQAVAQGGEGCGLEGAWPAYADGRNLS